MKKIFKVLAVILLITLNFTVVECINALTGFNDGKVTPGNGSGSGQFDDSAVGLKITVVNQAGTVGESHRFFNKNNESVAGKYFFSGNGPKFSQNDGQWGTTCNNCHFDSLSSDLSWGSVNFKDYLEKEEYKNLKDLLEIMGITELNENDFVVVEPMVKLGIYYGTAYEIVNSFINSSYISCQNGQYNTFASCYAATFYGAGYKSPVCQGCIYSTVYLSKADVRISNITISKANCADDDYDCKKDAIMYSNRGGSMGIYTASEIGIAIKKVTLTIIKTNSSGDPIIGKTAKFGIYSDSNCETKVTDLNIYADKGGIGTVSILPGTYYYKELKQPDRYEIDDTCRRITINKDEEIRVKNTMTCDSELDYILNKYNDKRLTETEKRTELIAIYLKYNNGDYTNLLNFDDPSCSKNTQCSSNINSDSGCLTAKLNYDVAGKENNLSCFNDKIQIKTNNNSTAIAFCFENFNLWNTLSSANNYEYIQSYNFNGNYFKSGQMILNRTNSLIAQGKVYKMCYVYGIGINDIIEKDPIVEEKNSYSDYVGDLMLNGAVLGGTTEYEKFNCSGTGNKAYNNGEWCVKTFTAAGHNGVSYLYLQKYYYKNYDLNKVYVNNGTGREADSYPCENCKFLGYGFISKLYNGNNPNCSYIDSTQKELGLNCIVPWSIKFTLKDQETEFESDTCTYNIKDEIVDCIGDDCSGNTPKFELQLEFRIIDTDNPFPGKSGQGRTPGSNWRLNNNIEDFDFDKDGVVTLKDILILRKTIAGSVSLPETISNIEIYDINKNGKVDIKDAFLIQKITRKEVAGVLSLAKTVMDLTNNSYNKNGTGPKYTITLTSDTIKEIRNYNRTNSYDDYNLTCDENGYNCESTFLKDLKEGIVNGNPVSSILVDIEEETGKFNWNPKECGECLIGNSISIFDYKKTN